MDTPRKAYSKARYQNPFQSPRANPKHAGHQVNGETRKSQAEIILASQVNKRSK